MSDKKPTGKRNNKNKIIRITLTDLNRAESFGTKKAFFKYQRIFVGTKVTSVMRKNVGKKLPFCNNCSDILIIIGYDFYRNIDLPLTVIPLRYRINDESKVKWRLFSFVLSYNRNRRVETQFLR